jgi:hypothetical protein
MTTLPTLSITADGTGALSGVFPLTFAFSVTPAGSSTPVSAFDVSREARRTHAAQCTHPSSVRDT